MCLARHLTERQNVGLATIVFRSTFVHSKLYDLIMEINPMLILYGLSGSIPSFPSGPSTKRIGPIRPIRPIGPSEKNKALIMQCRVPIFCFWDRWD